MYETLTYRDVRDDNPLKTPLCSSVMSLLYKRLRRQYCKMPRSHAQQTRFILCLSVLQINTSTVNHRGSQLWMHVLDLCMINHPKKQQKKNNACMHTCREQKTKIIYGWSLILWRIRKPGIRESTSHDMYIICVSCTYCRSVNKNLTYRVTRDDNPLNNPLCSLVIRLLSKYLKTIANHGFTFTWTKGKHRDNKDYTRSIKC